jgi:hypothetical protein
MKNYKEIIEKISDKLVQNGLYYSGNEFNTLDESKYGSSDFKVLICRLSTYRDTAQSFTHPILYKLITGIENTFADMAYLPLPSDLEVLRKNSIPLLLPVKTKADPLSYDVIAISNSLVQELLNIETLLKESCIEPDHSKRIGNEDQPLVIMGGSNSANCHFLMHRNSPVDLVYTNEDPDDIVSFFSRIRELKLSGSKKEYIIETLFKEFPVVCPVRGESGIRNSVSTEYKAKIQSFAAPVLFKEDPHSTNLVISRGCPWFCSFCNESFRSKPYSEISTDEVMQAANSIKKYNGSDEVSLFSFNFNAHSQIENMLGELHKNFRIVSLKSQRFDILSKKPEFLKIMQFSGKTGITCGLEGISARMRSYLSKDLSSSELEQSLSALLNSPIRTLKIFMIAAGIETEEDINELRSLLRFIKDSFQNRPRPPRIVFSLTPLVRFPGTPLGIDQAYPVSVMQKIIDDVSKAVTSVDFEFRTANPAHEYWVSQVLLRNNSAEFYEAVQKTVRESGFIYYKAVHKGFYDKICANLRAVTSDPDELLNSGLELEHYNSNLKNEFILKANKRSNEFTDTVTCYSIKSENSHCNDCGACESEVQRKAAMIYSKGAGLTVDKLKEIQAKYAQGAEVSVPVILTGKCRGLTNRYLGAVFTSAFIQSVPEGENHIKRFIRFKNRERFQTEDILGADEAVFLCVFDKAEDLKNQIGTLEFKDKFKKYAQGFGGSGDAETLHDKLIISISSDKKIDTSFINKFHIRSTVIKIKDGVYEAQVAKDGLKKKQFSKVLISIVENKIEVSYGEKFDLNEFIKIFCDSYKIKPEAMTVEII